MPNASSRTSASLKAPMLQWLYNPKEYKKLEAKNFQKKTVRVVHDYMNGKHKSPEPAKLIAETLKGKTSPKEVADAVKNPNAELKELLMAVQKALEKGDEAAAAKATNKAVVNVETSAKLAKTLDAAVKVSTSNTKKLSESNKLAEARAAKAEALVQKSEAAVEKAAVKVEKASPKPGSPKPGSPLGSESAQLRKEEAALKKKKDELEKKKAELEGAARKEAALKKAAELAAAEYERSELENARMKKDQEALIANRINVEQAYKHLKENKLAVLGDATRGLAGYGWGTTKAVAGYGWGKTKGVFGYGGSRRSKRHRKSRARKSRRR
jgi:hypothetical protein